MLEDKIVARRKKYDKSVYQSLALITQFGINMLVPVFLCSFAGIWLDEKCGTSFWMILLFFVGALAGFRNIYIMAKRIYDSKDRDAHDR
ncbi:MAG: AtpZ/AtpI family protein [Lachnospiraceae bacterium]|nr:AtpZ/AtpI family protein [Lachnospiraceae bacterium]MDE6128917.1 AtpZ/AtpI family protein [Lachnospiraceae bacterium]